MDVQCNTWLFLINPVNDLAFVCLSFHFMMLGSSYELSKYQFAESWAISIILVLVTFSLL